MLVCQWTQAEPPWSSPPEGLHILMTPDLQVGNPATLPVYLSEHQNQQKLFYCLYAGNENNDSSVGILMSISVIHLNNFMIEITH